MPIGRMLNRKIAKDDKVASLSVKAALLYTWMIPHADCEGRMIASPGWLKYHIVPLLSYFNERSILPCLIEIQKRGLIQIYGINNSYLVLVGFSKNQKINKDREAPSEIPTPELLMSSSGITPLEVEVKAKEETKGEPPFFLELWSQYPNKDGKKDALKHYVASVVTEQDRNDIQTALTHYLKSERVSKGFVKNGSTWFNGWRDWIPQKTVEVKKKSHAEIMRDINGA